MSDFLLSIYIPTFNREDYLCELLVNLREEIGPYKNKVEVVISDNCSQDHTEERAKVICRQYIDEGYSFRYHKNETNIGGCRNYLQCTDYVTGRYCWILGDDDMLLNGSLRVIIDTMEKYRDSNLEYYCVNFAYIKMHERECYLKDIDAQKEIEPEWHFFRNYDVRILKNFGELFYIDSKKPAHVCTFLGGNIFNCEVWNRYRSILDLNRDSFMGNSSDEEFHMTLDYVFPHLKIIAKAWMHQPIGYIGIPCVGLGVGAQENSSQNWRYIETVVFDELSDWYVACNMPIKEYEQFQQDFLPRYGKGLARLMAEHDKQFNQQDFLKFTMKYCNNELFTNAFLEGLEAYMISPAKSRYHDFCIHNMEGTLYRYIQENKKIAIWGTGEIAEAILKNCKGLSEHICLLIDGNKKKWGKEAECISGMTIQSPEILKKEKIDLIVISSVYYTDDILKHIYEMGIHTEILSSKGFLSL